MNDREALAKMVLPSHKRPVWSHGICQIQVTRACDLSCFSCTQASNLAGKPVIMTPDEFETAVKSLGFGVPGQPKYFGIVGCFGGNPALSPYFEDYCRILRALVPFSRRGIWCNHPKGKGKLMKITFNPATSNLNTHMSQEAYDEFARDWEESVPYLKGLDRDSVHTSPWVAMMDVEPNEAKRWDMIASCDVNRWWSSLVGKVPGRGLRAYACEIMYTQAVMHADDPDWPDLGLPVEPGWWTKPLKDFEAQFRWHCHRCGIPLRRPGQLAIGGEREEFSETHRSIARPKVRDRPVEIVETIGLVSRPARPATEYLPGTTPKVRA